MWGFFLDIVEELDDIISGKSFCGGGRYVDQ